MAACSAQVLVASLMFSAAFAAERPAKCVAPPAPCDYDNFVSCKGKNVGDACHEKSDRFGDYDSECTLYTSSRAKRCREFESTGKTEAGGEVLVGDLVNCPVPQAVKVAAGYHDGKGENGQIVDENYVPSTESKCDKTISQGGCPTQSCARYLYQAMGKQADGKPCNYKSTDKSCMFTPAQCEQKCRDHTTFVMEDTEAEIKAPCTHFAVRHDCKVTGTVDKECCLEAAACYLMGECATLVDYEQYTAYKLSPVADGVDPSGANSMLASVLAPWVVGGVGLLLFGL